MNTIKFESVVELVNDMLLIRLTKLASEQLPSRGMCFVTGTINGTEFQAPLEPDGRWINFDSGSHWFQVDEALQLKTGLKSGDNVAVEIKPVTNKDWPEPDVPADLAAALQADQEAKAVWDKTTPAARWDWVRSVRSTKNAETRARRIVTACSKLRSGKPRQCCFNRSECTFPEVSKGGVLLDPVNH